MGELIFANVDIPDQNWKADASYTLVGKAIAMLPPKRWIDKLSFLRVNCVSPHLELMKGGTSTFIVWTP